MIILDYRDTRPLYEQIVDKFQMLILSGALEPNSRMPSVRSLAVELSINPNTIQRAYSELERNGFLYTVKGKGNYVAYSDSLKDVRKQEILEKLRDLKKEALSMGMTVKELTEFLERWRDRWITLRERCATLRRPIGAPCILLRPAWEPGVINWLPILCTILLSRCCVMRLPIT